jgi:hypothetical protein
VLSNYFGSDWRNLKQTSGPYNRLLREAQDRLWRPYAVATALHWQRPQNPDWSAYEVWPQLYDWDFEAADL